MSLGQEIAFLRYPGGKQRQLPGFDHLLPSRTEIADRYVEPFLGGGSVFFSIKPRRALLSDINSELIVLYRGVRRYPEEVWDIFSSLPATKKAYYETRDWRVKNLAEGAARMLYLNRTCFGGMWRHNADGEFNVGYGGEDRRGAVSREDLLEISKRLRRTSLRCCDFEEIVDACEEGDFIFLDPPYKPGEREMSEQHYSFDSFSFQDQKRLANALRKATSRSVLWAMTNSSHPDILSLYANFNINPLLKGTGRRIGQITATAGEVLIRNYG